MNHWQSKLVRLAMNGDRTQFEEAVDDMVFPIDDLYGPSRFLDGFSHNYPGQLEIPNGKRFSSDLWYNPNKWRSYKCVRIIGPRIQLDFVRTDNGGLRLICLTPEYRKQLLKMKITFREIRLVGTKVIEVKKTKVSSPTISKKRPRKKLFGFIG